MKRLLILATLFVVPLPALAQSKPCEELKSEIAKKLEANGVTAYSLEIVAKDSDAEGKVVGTCEGGTKKIVYSKTKSEASKQTTDAKKG